MQVINEFIIGQAGALWVYPLLLVVCVVDGFFPPVPSETVLVTLASLSGSTGRPYLAAIIVIAAVGAIVGDNIAYTIGKRVGTERFRWMRTPKGKAAFAWARRGLDKRGAAVILTARYIPIGRIAVNMTAGATGYPRRKFVPLTILGGVTWALYSSLMGRLVGGWFESQPLLGAVISVCVAVVLGIGIDHVMQRLRHDEVDIPRVAPAEDESESESEPKGKKPGPARNA
ncbi:DedA family protein [Rhodococcus coprophilus]|uniref:Hypothetical membrane protein n=1 Tax=Rhodococcus coprophilus TaxID=38310 RepID=A0A2X4WZE9_9NOCA|nr:DedA family protein [Rhodococcus coprophilus]MBM7457331.1 membrane protein DedA with SNARE-associated domain [Rhodococcus coprophilus]SQI29544.1 hypothetical membrane protein [Rhodococcus coprophilus]